MPGENSNYKIFSLSVLLQSYAYPVQRDTFQNYFTNYKNIKSHLYTTEM